MNEQSQLFEVLEEVKKPSNSIKTAYADEKELLGNILFLYNNGKSVDLDSCYSVGRFWDGLPKPKLKFDINPQVTGVEKASCDNLPVENSSVNSIMFDPPFVIGVSSNGNGIMTNRFSGFKNLNELKTLYTNSLKEFYRTLKTNGILIFKCQDTVTSGKQFLTHVFVINEAEKIGFYSKDLFIIVRDRAIIDPKWGEQQHARKNHSYYLVFQKRAI